MVTQPRPKGVLPFKAVGDEVDGYHLKKNYVFLLYLHKPSRPRQCFTVHFLLYILGLLHTCKQLWQTSETRRFLCEDDLCRPSPVKYERENVAYSLLFGSFILLSSIRFLTVKVNLSFVWLFYYSDEETFSNIFDYKNKRRETTMFRSRLDFITK